MLARTHHLSAPWMVVRVDDKLVLHVNIIKNQLIRLDCKDKIKALVLPDADIVFNYKQSYLHNSMITP